MSAKFDQQLVGPNQHYTSAAEVYRDFNYYYKVKDASTNAIIVPMISHDDAQNFNTLTVNTRHQIDHFNYANLSDYKLLVFKRYASHQWPVDFWRHCITPDAVAEKTATVILSLLGGGRKVSDDQSWFITITS